MTKPKASAYSSKSNEHSSHKTYKDDIHPNLRKPFRIPIRSNPNTASAVITPQTKPKNNYWNNTANSDVRDPHNNDYNNKDNAIEPESSLCKTTHLVITPQQANI